MKLIIYILCFFCSTFLIFGGVDAAITIVSPHSQLPGSDRGILDSDTTGAFIGSFISWLIGITAVLTIISVTWAGVNMVLAAGDEEKMKKARLTMIYSFTGLIIAGLAYGIVKFITNLNLNSFL